MKPIRFLGDALKSLRQFPEDARQGAVYVLHAFQKKTKATSKHDLAVAKTRYSELMQGRT